MYTLIALVLALTVKTDLTEPKVLEPKVLYHNTGELQPNAQLVASFYIKKDIVVKVEAKGNGNGDIDCYLLKHNESDWVIIAHDESNLDQCSISYSTSVAQPLRLWIVNHGVHSTNYTVSVKQ